MCGLRLSHHSRLQLLLQENCLEESIDGAQGVHLWELLTHQEPEFDLFELLFDGGGHHDGGFFGVLGAGVVVEGDLLVTRAGDADAQLEVAGDLVEVFAVGVGHADPLVEYGVLVLEVDKGHIEIKCSY